MEQQVPSSAVAAEPAEADRDQSAAEAQQPSDEQITTRLRALLQDADIQTVTGALSSHVSPVGPPAVLQPHTVRVQPENASTSLQLWSARSFSKRALGICVQSEGHVWLRTGPSKVQLDLL